MKKDYRVYLSGTDYSAEGIYHLETKTLTVLAGSKIKEVENVSLRKNYGSVADIKDQLIEQAIIIDNEFMKDYQFSHVFHASAIVSSYGKAGRKSWKLKNGKTIEELEEVGNNIQRFIKYAQAFTVADLEGERKKENGKIEEFRELFPLDRLRDLTLEEYDSRGSNESLAYMIEHGTNEIFRGFLGSNRNKIFYQQKDNTYDCIQYVKDMFPGKSMEEMFAHYRNGLYRLVTEFSKDTYSKGSIDGLPGNTNTIRGKLIMLYHPGKLLHFNSRGGFDKLFEYFGLNPNQKDSIMMNIELQQFLGEIGIKSNGIETSRILWTFFSDHLREQKNNDEQMEKVISTSEETFENIFLEDDYIAQFIRILQRKKAVILKGVPGVGKTFVVKDIIRKSFSNIGDHGIEMIQFHQSYAYEEFIEGLKPQMDGSFKPEKGLFYDIAKRAEDDPENNYFLIIDEINRGNISKIFGELMMLIENDKRDEYAVKLAYSKELFTVPSNLYVIGTMNTADRSLTLVDYALRRRFSFLTIEPTFGTTKFNNFLQRKMDLKEVEINQINHVMKEVNTLIINKLSKDFMIGHSYFVSNKDSIDDFQTWYKDIVIYEIMPMMEEYFFDDEDTVQTIEGILCENNV